MLVLDIAYTIYHKFGEYASALRIALAQDNIQVFIYLFNLSYIFLLLAAYIPV